MKNKWIAWIIVAGAATTALIIYLKKKSKVTISGLGGAAPVLSSETQSQAINPTKEAPIHGPELLQQPLTLHGSNDENVTFQNLATILENDSIWKTKKFPEDFYIAVNEEYQNILAGKPRTPDYHYGKPGAFMSMADAWQSAMGYGDTTHAQLWQVYDEFRKTYSTAKVLSFEGWNQQKHWKSLGNSAW